MGMDEPVFVLAIQWDTVSQAVKQISLLCYPFLAFRH